LQDTTDIASHRDRLSTQPGAPGRDGAIDTMRGIAILMVIGIHSLQQPLAATWQIPADAALRPCVPVFLFATGYLTGLTGRVPLGRRLRAALVPYSIAFVAAFIYMALHNAAMDFRTTTTVARFLLAYVFVYYYVFVYVGCTLYLWLVFRISGIGARWSEQRRVIVLMFSIALGLIAGSYLDPLLFRLGFSDSLVEEARMRDVPFWFSFAALGVLAASSGAVPTLRNMRVPMLAVTLVTYLIYAVVRLLGLGDAADYDSMAFFGYAIAFCATLVGLGIRLPSLATLGSGSYFIYLWHIFIVMILRDHAALQQLGPLADTAITYTVTTAVVVIAMLLVRHFFPLNIAGWLGA
jgi:surface polysaccharide O-acyltransferase-like enzyme